MKKISGIIIISFGLIVIIGFFYFYFPKTNQTQQVVKENIPETIIDKTYSALAKVTSVDQNNHSIMASVFMPQQTSSFNKDFGLTAVSKTQNQPATKDFQLLPDKRLVNDPLFDKIKPNDVIFIETKENILDPQITSLNLTAIQKPSIK
ncbi:hypothetical protein HZB04_03850 [Candidatus Wolfebacteria bacterium]|nr:hypothetical protein [Candidatus Wolfebacteria bacterium]